MKIMKNRFLILSIFLVTTLIHAQETFILNYEEVDVRKVTQDIAQFSKKTIILQ